QVVLNLGTGQFKEVPSEQFGLALKGKGVSCAVGDYDNDGVPDLAVALEDRIVLFKNEGKGKFLDTTKNANIQSLSKPAGMTFVDYDHDGDLDLLIAGSNSTENRTAAYIVWRNTGNGTFE